MPAVAAALALAGCGGGSPASPPDDRRAAAGSCEPGSERASRVLRRAVVLGCARAPDGTRFRLVTRDGRCLVLQGLPRGERACGVAPGRRDPRLRAALGGAVFVRLSPRSRTELYGEARPDVRRVTVRFRHRGRMRERRAALLEVRDPRALSAARLSARFGYFVAFVPAGARAVVAEAHGRGRRLGSLRFDPVLRSLHPRAFAAAAKP